MILIKGLVTVKLLYWMPDHNLLQEFSWQTGDYIPEFPRMKKFLSHWEKNIEADIEEIYLMHTYHPDWRKVDNDFFF
jgi:uncharacterized protein Usg